MGKPTRQPASAHRAERIAAAQQVLAERVAEIGGGDDWRRFLAFQSRLHGYSATNVMLIVAQHQAMYAKGLVAEPVPTYVASYRRWQELGRQVDKGQRGIAIFAPMRGTSRRAVGPGGAWRPLGKGEEPAAGESVERRMVVRGFTVEKVFSAEQTTGDPLPERPSPTPLTGAAPDGLAKAVTRLIEARGFTLTACDTAATIGGANGQTDWSARTVTVRADMDDAAIVKTLIHEAAHVMLHNPDDKAGGSLPRGHKEVEAESVAFIVGAAHGLDTSEYSFAYVASWAGADHEQTVRKTATRVAACAKQIIAASPADHTPDGKGETLALAAGRSAPLALPATAAPPPPGAVGAAPALI